MNMNTKAILGTLALSALVAPASADAVFEYLRFRPGGVEIGDNETGEAHGGAFFDRDDETWTAAIDTPNITGTVNAYANDTAFGGFMDVTGDNGYATVSAHTNRVRVSETTEVLFEWDKQSSNVDFVGGMLIFDDAAGADLFQPLSGTSGSVVLTLEAGQNYGMLWRMSAVFQEPGDYANLFLNISIVPAPSGLALLGMGGLGLTRRRR